jgi:molybdenum cofactor cytidylyltransferase
MRVSGVILAAGSSSRLGRPKQLLTLDGEPIARVVARNALTSKLAEIILVTGGSAEAVAETVADLPVHVVENPEYRDGQSTSLIRGLQAVSASVDGVLFLLGDQPEVDGSVLDALINAYETTGGPIVQPVYGETPANPVIFARSLFPELLGVTGDEGARAVVKRHQSEIVPAPFPDRQPPGDIDTEEDYQAMIARWARRKANAS